MNRLLAETVGTFVLVFAGTGAILVDQTYGGVGHVGVALSFGLAVLVMIYAVGDVSGAHLNPAVTLGLTVAGKFKPADVPGYVAAQVVGAFAASGLLRVMFPESVALGTTAPAGAEWASFVAEVVTTFVLVLTVLATTRWPKERMGMVGVAVGGAIALDALFAGRVSGASMNPARSLAPAVVSGHMEHLWLYLVAPVVGAVAAASWSRVMTAESKSA